MEINPALLGLNKYELQVYEALVKLGKSTASKISKLSEVPYGKIYEVLASLDKKGFVSVIMGESKYFIPSNPEKIIELIRGKKKELDNFEEEVSNLKKFYNLPEEQIIEISEGQKGFFKILDKLPPPKNTEYNLRYFFSGKPRPAFISETKKRLKKEIIIKTLADKNRFTKDVSKEWGKVLTDIRHIKNKGVAMSIVDDNSIMIALIRSNITLLIKDKAFIEIMKTFFINTYNKAEKIR